MSQPEGRGGPLEFSSNLNQYWFRARDLVAEVIGEAPTLQVPFSRDALITARAICKAAPTSEGTYKLEFALELLDALEQVLSAAELPPPTVATTDQERLRWLRLGAELGRVEQLAWMATTGGRPISEMDELLRAMRARGGLQKGGPSSEWTKSIAPHLRAFVARTGCNRLAELRREAQRWAEGQRANRVEKFSFPAEAEGVERGIKRLIRDGELTLPP